jgi:hypothetical protein
MEDSIKTIVGTLINGFKSQLGIASPSKVMQQIGEYTGQGFINGLTESTKTLDSIVGGISSKAINGLQANVARQNMGNGATSTNTNVTNNYNLVQNNTSPKALTALETYQARRQQLEMMKLYSAI